MSKLFSLMLVLLVLTQVNCTRVKFASKDDNNNKTNCTKPDCKRNPPPGEPENPGSGCKSETLADCLREVTGSVTVPTNNNKADILFVIDNSGSMSAQITELYTRFPNFIASLGTLDWQICVTTTDHDKSYDGTKGGLRNFPNGQEFINSSTPNAQQEFAGLLQGLIGVSASGDERGILSINKFLSRADSRNCLRQGASFHTIVLSDEDERSTGGVKGSKQYRELEPLDEPDSVFTTLSSLAATIGTKVYSHHSIIIQPNDTACFNTQDAEAEAFYGRHYFNLSAQTKGIQGTICSSNYTAQLNNIAANVQQTLASMPLECKPVDQNGHVYTAANQIIDSIVPASSSTATLVGNKINFAPALPAGTVVTVSYHCFK